MSMEHKAFLFDSIKFDLEIKKVLENCWDDTTVNHAVGYIDKNYQKLKSPYTGETLDVDWQREIVEKNIQNYLEFILTTCYDPGEDIGLQYSWDALIDVLQQINVDKNVKSWILGNELIINGKKFDPGKMGFGILDKKEVKEIWQSIIQAKSKLIGIELKEEYLYEMTYEDIKIAYDDLCDIYKIAVEKDLGFIMTF